MLSLLIALPLGTRGREGEKALFIINTLYGPWEERYIFPLTPLHEETLLAIHLQLHPFLLTSRWIHSQTSLRSTGKTWKTAQTHPFPLESGRVGEETHGSTTALLPFPLPSPTSDTLLSRPASLHPSIPLHPSSHTHSTSSPRTTVPTLALTTQTRLEQHTPLTD